MAAATRAGWQQLTAGWPWFSGEGRHPIAAYSEFMPPPRVGLAPYGPVDPLLFDERDPWGWRVTRVRGGVRAGARASDKLAEHLLGSLAAAGAGAPGARHPESLPDRQSVLARGACRTSAGRLAHERCVLLMPLALSRTQDDKGRVRWTLFGVSEQGPARAFWQSFFSAPGIELPEPRATGWLRRLLAGAYGLSEAAGRGSARRRLAHPADGEGSVASPTGAKSRCRAGPGRCCWRATSRSTASAIPADVPSVRASFRAPVQRAYLDGALHLLPFPGSLVFWGVPQYRKLAGRAALRDADSVAASRRASRGAVGNPGAAIGLAPRRQAGAGRPRDASHGPAAQSLQAHAPLGSRPASPGRARADGSRRHARARALQHARGRRAPLRQADGPQRADLVDATSERVLDGPDGDARGPEGGRRRAESGRPSSAIASSIRRCASAATRSTGSGRSPRFSTRRRGRQRCCAMDRSATSRPTTPRSSTSRDRSSCGRACSSGRRTSRPSSSPGRRTRPSRTRRAATPASCSTRQTCSAQPALPSSFARSLLTAAEHATLESWLEQLPATAGAPEPAARLASELRARGTAAPEPTPPGALSYARTARRSFEIQLLEDDRVAGGGPLPDQEQRGLRPRRGDAEASRPPAPRSGRARRSSAEPVPEARRR